MNQQTALVIAGGAFGTSIASVLSHNFKRVILLVRSKDVYESLQNGENKIYLPGMKLSPKLVPAMSWEEVEKKTVGEVGVIISGLPCDAIKSFCIENYNQLSGYLKKRIPIVSLSKGIDPNTLEMPDDLFYHSFLEFKDLFCYLSGPSFAKEILEEQITLVSVAGHDRETLERVGKMLQTPFFNSFLTYDVKGLLLGGSLKNILAIAGGIIEGLGYNFNTRAALITRGIVEMLRLGHVYNARPETFYGLSGMGDLILSTTGTLSRNKLFGIEIAKGRKPKEIIQSQRAVVEGYQTTKAAYLLAEKFKVRTTIFNGIYQVLYEDLDPKRAMTALMRLPPRFEVE